MKLRKNIKSTRIGAIALVFALVCSITTAASGSANSVISVFGENYTLAAASWLENFFGFSAKTGDLKNSSPAENTTINLLQAANGNIVFTRLNNFGDIYTVNPNSLNPLPTPTPLATHPNDEGHPSYSPDGSKIVFESKSFDSIYFDVVVMNADGTGSQTNLTGKYGNADRENMQPVFSPNADKIVFVSKRDGNEEIYVMDAHHGDDPEGYPAKRLTNNSAIDVEPSWSPDGEKIVFASTRFGGYYDICVIDAELGDSAPVEHLTVGVAEDREPVYSPDGSKIAFTVNSSDQDVFVMGVHGENPKALTDNVSISDSSPAFSPDGNLIAFSREGDIYLMNAVHGEELPDYPVTQITEGGNLDTNPRWQPVVPQCTLNLNAFSANLSGAAATNKEVKITANQSFCEWTAQSNNVDWITITSATSGKGTYTIKYSVTANPGQTRTGTMTIAGHTFTVTQSDNYVHLTIPGNFVVHPNESEVLVPVQVSDTTGRGILSYDFEVAFDSNVLRPTYNGELLPAGVQTVGTKSQLWSVFTNTNTSGKIIVAGGNSTYLSGAGILIYLKFDIIGTLNGCLPLHFNSSEFNDINDGPPIAAAHDGTLCRASSVSGKVTYANAPQELGVPDVSLTAYGSPTFATTTATDGSYSLDDFGSGEYWVYPAKTSGTNIGISAYDAAQIALYAIDRRAFTPSQRKAADVSENGYVNIFDAALILRYSVGYHNNTGSTGEWRFDPGSVTYNNLQGNINGEDYCAVLLGDVTGDWTPPNALAKFGGEAKTESNAVPVSLPTIGAARNQVVTVPVMTGDVTGRNLLAYGMDISYNPAILQPDTANPFDANGTMSAGLTVAANPNTPGHLLVTAYGVNYLQGAGVLLNLRFRVIGQNGQVSPLTFERFVFNEDPSQSVTQNGQIIVQTETSASVEVGGRITTTSGNGIRNVRVTMTDANGNVRTALSSSLGYYRFTGVAVGANYVFTVSAKRYSFNQPVQSVNINGETENIDFVAENQLIE